MLVRGSRLEIPLGRSDVPGVARLGRYQNAQAEPGLDEHSHGGAIEICFLVKGRQTYRMGGRDHHLRGGDVFLSRPGETHSTGVHPQEKGMLYWMILSAPRRGQDYLGLPAARGRALWLALRAVPRPMFRGTWRLKDHLDAMVLLQQRPRSTLRALATAAEVHAFLLEVLACAGDSGLSHARNPLERSRAYITSHLGDPLPVPLLAGVEGLSVARFKERFKQETGIPPGEYVLRAKITEAKRRLSRTSAPVTRIAFDLGFSSSQYFATVFKRFTRQKPGEFRRGAMPGPGTGTPDFY